MYVYMITATYLITVKIIKNMFSYMCGFPAEFYNFVLVDVNNFCRKGEISIE